MEKSGWSFNRITALFVLSLWGSGTHADTIPVGARPLSTLGNQIVTADGKPVVLKSVSWFGGETSTYCPHGLWSRNYKSMLDQIKEVGFNTIRLTFCNQAFDAGSMPNGINTQLNPDLVGLNTLQIFDKIIQYADSIGLCIILDHHRSDAGGGPNGNGLWYTSTYPESRFINDWVMLANRYKNNPSVIGCDLNNECHAAATWGTADTATDWQAAATRTGNAILAVNPNLLIIVEGIEAFQNHFYWWGGNLMGVKNAPVKLNIANKIIYSPHDYPNSIYAQPWFSDPNFPNNLPNVFHNAWGYIFEQNIAPIWIGEFGSKFVDPKDAPWMDKITAYLNGDFTGSGSSQLSNNQQGMSWSWWSWNPNSGDTGGILLDDWQTVDQVKLNHLAPLLAKPSVLDSSVTPTGGPVDTVATLSVLYQNESDATGTAIKAGLIIVNNSSEAIPLSDITLRYWYNSDQQKPQNFWVDAAAIGCCNISGRLVELATSSSMANAYLEISFSVNSGFLHALDNSGEIHIRLTHVDGSSFSQSNDYSFDALKTTFAPWTHITAYHNGVLIWGTEPQSSQTPPPPPQKNCAVQYTIANQWNNGYVASVTISNNGPTDIIGWTLQWQFPTKQTIINLWNGLFTANGNQITVNNAAWNDTIPAGGSITFGFQASFAETVVNPNVFQLNGANC